MWHYYALVWLCLFSVLGSSSTCQVHGDDSPAPSRYTAAIETSRTAIRTMMSRAGVPGVALAVAVDGRIAWEEGFGLADLERRVAVTPQTRFGIGSITKSLTLALTARLAEEKLLDLDAPLERYLPDFPHKGRSISIRLIGCHLSGLDDSVDVANRLTSTRYSSAEALRLMNGETIKYGVRERSHYTTGPFTFIAAATEQATGKAFPELLQHYITQPLAMNETMPNVRRSIIANRTCFYELEKGQSVHAPFAEPSYKLAGAGYLSTVGDLARFGSALLKPGLLRESTLEELFQPQKTASGEATPFALGWRVVKDRTGRAVLAQPGGGPGISSMLVIYRKEKLVIAVLSNQTGAPVGLTILDPIADAFIGKSN